MIQNKVAESELVTLDLSIFLPKEQPLFFDIKDYLFRGLILKEKDFRNALSTHNWNDYKERTVLIFCSADAIVPVWAYMLIVANLYGITTSIFFENEATWRERKIIESIDELDISVYTDRRVVIKGCGEEKIPDAAYVSITKKILPVVKSIMYGEPCSTVPIFKKK
jgi:hypothetical protein